MYYPCWGNISQQNYIAYGEFRKADKVLSKIDNAELTIA